MANSAGSKKRARQAVKRRAHNASQRSMVRTYVKKVVKQIEAKNYDEASKALTTAQPVIDGMARKGIISKNKASRTMSRLSARVKALKAA
ncbi:30S ribosomal protein S20 [Saccharospirillum sp. MSK14-1]|mgnify:CR=1 FL=1|uniref:30S ribosomal protein S20 n=1 Tax=Saccharospirillum sp. MSK14-1 TaxID=1897632 RepID=UPI000D38A82A|nr:30S ribosomal protein S20 [Saccharospirillum sp. MSK14-1]PTY38114.1 30S ribosomal protein S20 [Saccharospirillum sp. MSK14-1]